MSTTPVIRTDRLLLRAFSDDDAAPVQRLVGDRRIADTTISIPHPYPNGAAENWIITHEADWELGQGLILAIVLRKTSELAGAIGLSIQPENRTAEIGYWLGVPYWNQGFTTEAARALIEYGFDKLNLHRIHAHHFARNVASGRVLEKAGMQHEGLRRQAQRKWDGFEDIRELGLLRSDWLAQRNLRADS